MLDVTMLRKNLPEVVARLKTRNFDFPVDAFNELEERRKSVQKKTEELQARRNSLSKGHRHDEEEWGGCFRAARSGSCYSG